MEVGIRPKLLAAFAVVALFTGVLGWYAVKATERLDEEQRTLYSDIFGGTNLLATWIDNTWEARSDLLSYLLAEDPAERSRLRARMLELDQTIDDLGRQMDLADSDRQDVDTLNALDMSWQRYADWRDGSVIAPFEAGDRAAALNAYQANGENQNAAINAAIDEFLTRKREVGTGLQATGAETSILTRDIAVGLTASATGLALLVGFLLSHGIADAAGQAARAARGLARGDLDQKINVHSKDELGQMAAAFGEMIDHQQRMAAAADAIAHGDLSQRVEPKSAVDVLGNAFVGMNAKLRALIAEHRDAVQRANAQAQLAEERETRVRAVMDSVADGILTLDDNGIIQSINPAGEQIFVSKAADVVGQRVDRLLPEAFQAGFTNGHAANAEAASPKLLIGERREVRGVDGVGSPLSVELTLSEARLNGRSLHIAVVRDITGRKRADQRRGVQYAVSWALAGARTLDVAISGILHAIAEGFDWQVGIFWSMDSSADVLRCHAIWHARHIAAEDFVAACRQMTFERGEGLPGRAWQTRQPLSVSDAPGDLTLTPRLETAVQEGLHGAFAFPIEAGSEVLGVIELFSNEVRPADLDLIMTVTAIGQQIAQFIERDRAEEAVHESEARKRAILEGALDCVISIDEDSKILEFNAAAEQTFGYPREAVLNKNLADLLVPPRLRKAHRRGLAAYVATGAAKILNKRVEVWALRADGTEFPLELSVTPIPSGGRALFTGFMRDITGPKRAEQEIRSLNAGLEERVRERTAQLQEALTERKWAAEKLEQLRRRNELILTSAGEGIYGVDCNGRATFINPAAAALTGHEVSQLVERPLHEVLRHSGPDGPAYPSADCPICAVLRDGSIRVGDAMFFRQDGSTFPASYTSTPIWEQATIVGAVVTFQDVTERRAMDRLKDEFVSMVSHEIRTPMNGVLGMMELLIDTPLDARQREYADAARRSGEMLLAIVNDILDSAKIEAGKLELDVSDLDVRAVAEDVVGLFAAQAQAKGLEIGCLVHRDVPRGLLGDTGRLRQVLLNLVGNAIKFTERGEVTVSARVATRARDGVFIRFEVGDTGPGIAPDAAQRIFQPFSQADRSTTRKYGGTGLGLTISKRLVDLMGGQIGVETKPGEGSTFWFNTRLARQRFTGGAPPPPELRKLHVLAVDDNAITRAVLQEHLSAWGVSVRTADAVAPAIEALHAAAAQGAPFDVLILDRHLAGSDGLELARRVRSDSRLAATRLVLLSLLTEDPLPPDAESIGLTAWLTKPVRQSQLFDTLVSVATGTADITAGATGPLRQVRSSTETMAPGGPRVLVVEDTPINQQVARGMLARLGYSAELVSNGLQALEALSRGSYAAILMDCHMPQMDGFESSREIRRREGPSRHTPIIAMTASVMRGERERCIAAGMDDYVAKPVRLQELRTRLQRWSGLPVEVVQTSVWEAAEAADHQAQASGEAADVDPRVLLGMRSFQVTGEPDPVERLVELFLRDAPERLTRIRAALHQKDAQALQDAAHALKGSSSAVGAHRMEQLCAELEDRAASAALEGSGVIVQALEAAFERARTELDLLRTAAHDARP